MQAATSVVVLTAWSGNSAYSFYKENTILFSTFRTVLLVRLASYGLNEVRTGMTDEFAKAAAYLPAGLQELLLRLPDRLTGRIQEIRLRAGGPVVLSAPDGEWLLTKGGGASLRPAGPPVLCSSAQLEECFLKLCDYSVHTHQQEICCGFIATRSGCRAGIAGSAVREGERIVSVRNITSLCLRVARRHDGCARELYPALMREGTLCSLLICGEPSSGKSSLLKDLAGQLAAGEGPSDKRFRVAVVDERGELSGSGLTGCDVLRGYPKAEGIQQAVRCLAPDVVIFDELGTAAETAAVLEGLNAGVAAVTSAHCRDAASLLRRPQLKAALHSVAFDRIVFLEGRQNPGRVARVMEAGDLLAQGDRTFADRFGRNRRGSNGFAGA